MRLVFRRGDEALPASAAHLREPPASRVAAIETVPIRADESPARVRFEATALLADRVPAKPGDLIGVLLASALPISSRGCAVLRPLWANEAMHRAFSLMRLLQARNRVVRSISENTDATGNDDAIACDLALRFRELEHGGERDAMSCAAVLRDVVMDLGALFGCPANITVEAEIADVSLPAYKRRALVLAAAELVGNALLHAFRGCDAGRITVALALRGPRAACLRVADDGAGFKVAQPDYVRGVAGGLADLLEADLAYERAAGWTIAEIVFPIVVI